MALTEAETKAMPAAELEARIADVKERMLAAGASYVIRTIEELPALIETINANKVEAINANKVETINANK